jgi:hypothetical protein
LQINEKNKAHTYDVAYECEGAEFAQARNHMRFLKSNRGDAPIISLFGMNPNGALSDGAWKILNHLAK